MVSCEWAREYVGNPHFRELITHNSLLTID